MRINEGVFRDFVGVVEEVNELNGQAIVFIQVPGVCGPTPVELELRQIEPA